MSSECRRPLADEPVIAELRSQRLEVGAVHVLVHLLECVPEEHVTRNHHHDLITPKKRELNSEINGVIPVKKIVGSLDPALVENITPPLAMWSISRAHSAVEQAHTDDEWTEQVALEHLAVLSVVARWTDETELVK